MPQRALFHQTHPPISSKRGQRTVEYIWDVNFQRQRFLEQECPPHPGEAARPQIGVHKQSGYLVQLQQGVHQIMRSRYVHLVTD